MATKKGVRGRPPHEPTPDSRRDVEAYVAAGANQEHIAKLLSITVDTLVKHYRHELADGREVANGRIAGKLYEKALSGDSACMFFWLKTRARWQEIQRHEHVGDKNAPMEINHTGVDPVETLMAHIAQVRERTGNV